MSYFASYYWEKGKFRENNEDSFSLQRVRTGASEAAFLVVCDGIGGLPEGETASGFVTERLTEWFYRDGLRLMGGPLWKKRTARAAAAQLKRIQESMENYEKEDRICCGTTCTAAFVKNSSVLLMHTGDSRAYLVGKKERLLTEDHGRSGVLNRCVGGFSFDAPDFITTGFKPGELLILCSDGFSRCAPDGFFKGCLAAEPDRAGGWYRRLKGIGGFLAAQGERDNMTALLLKNCGKR